MTKLYAAERCSKKLIPSSLPGHLLAIITIDLKLYLASIYILVEYKVLPHFIDIFIS